MAESGMVEAVARAICCPDGCAGDTGSGRPCAIALEDRTAMWQARAAIAAMREPTEAMVLAAASTESMKAIDSMVALACIHGASLPPVPWQESAIANAHRAAIDAALSEP